MRALFVSGTATGGSAVSTNELSAALTARGHTVGVLTRHRTRPRSGLVAPARPRVYRAAAELPRRVARAAHRIGAATAGSARADDGIDRWSAVAPERVLAEVCGSFRPDVVVVGSIARHAWASIRATLRRLRVPSVLYVREAATLEHVPVAELRPDLTVTNSHALGAAVRALGLEAVTVPSIIDFPGCTVASSGEVALLVNPITSRGLALALAMAARNRDVPFAFQRSWPLDRRDERALARLVADHTNVELRDHEPDPARVYRDARVLLLPYLVDQRPRVVAEAQWNGIPVLASDLTGHREAVGDGGVFVGLGADPAAWDAGLRALWDDGETAERARTAARDGAKRSGQDGDVVARRFETLMAALVAGEHLA